MRVKVGRFWIVYGEDREVFDAEQYDIGEEEIEEYVKKNPMPEDDKYSIDDLIEDVAVEYNRHYGFLALSDELKPETREYVAKMIGALM